MFLLFTFSPDKSQLLRSKYAAKLRTRRLRGERAQRDWWQIRHWFYLQPLLLTLLFWADVLVPTLCLVSYSWLDFEAAATGALVYFRDEHREFNKKQLDTFLTTCSFLKAVDYWRCPHLDSLLKKFRTTDQRSCGLIKGIFQKRVAFYFLGDKSWESLRKWL